MRTTFNYIGPLLTLCSPALAGRPADEISFSCLPLTIEMSDPIMFPGNESDHLHLVAGGTAFQRTMAEDTARKAIGTTCGIEIDRSNYWVPELYHKTEGGFELVDVEGIELYYMNRACNYTEDATACDTQNEVAIAPPDGLRMVAGNPFLRTYNDSNPAQQAISHMCIREDGSSNETKHLPQEPCSLLRSQVFFPSCWDGKNVDTHDHHSHMSYPAIGHYNQGVCPPSHPIAIISIFAEFLFDTKPYPDYDNLVYAMGDPTGYGLHGDFVNGWTDLDALRDALVTCTGDKGLTDPSCSVTKDQHGVLAPQSRPMEVHSPKEEREFGQNGPIPELPGDNPVTGPGDEEEVGGKEGGEKDGKERGKNDGKEDNEQDESENGGSKPKPKPNPAPGDEGSGKGCWFCGWGGLK